MKTYRFVTTDDSFSVDAEGVDCGPLDYAIKDADGSTLGIVNRSCVLWIAVGPQHEEDTPCAPDATPA